MTAPSSKTAEVTLRRTSPPAPYPDSSRVRTAAQRSVSSRDLSSYVEVQASVVVTVPRTVPSVLERSRVTTQPSWYSTSVNAGPWPGADRLMFDADRFVHPSRASARRSSYPTSSPVSEEVCAAVAGAVGTRTRAATASSSADGGAGE